MSTQQFSQERLMNVLLAPQISEKATYVADKNEQVIFRVATDATKPEIKAAVEMMFKVSVDSVQVASSRARSSAAVVSSVVATTGRRLMCAWLPVRKSILLQVSKDNHHGID